MSDQDPSSCKYLFPKFFPTGLFRAGMDALSQEHTIGQTLRSALAYAGLFEKSGFRYLEALSCFGVVTRAMERKILGMESCARRNVSRLSGGAIVCSEDTRLAGGEDAIANKTSNPLALRLMQKLSNILIDHKKDVVDSKTKLDAAANRRPPNAKALVLPSYYMFSELYQIDVEYLILLKPQLQRTEPPPPPGGVGAVEAPSRLFYSGVGRVELFNWLVGLAQRSLHQQNCTGSSSRNDALTGSVVQDSSSSQPASSSSTVRDSRATAGDSATVRQEAEEQESSRPKHQGSSSLQQAAPTAPHEPQLLRTDGSGGGPPPLHPDFIRIMGSKLATPHSILSKYLIHLDKASDLQLCAALFILWGPLLIGGGASARNLRAQLCYLAKVCPECQFGCKWLFLLEIRLSVLCSLPPSPSLPLPSSLPPSLPPPFLPFLLPKKLIFWVVPFARRLSSWQSVKHLFRDCGELNDHGTINLIHEGLRSAAALGRAGEPCCSLFKDIPVKGREERQRAFAEAFDELELLVVGGDAGGGSEGEATGGVRRGDEGVPRDHEDGRGTTKMSVEAWREEFLLEVVVLMQWNNEILQSTNQQRGNGWLSRRLALCVPWLASGLVILGAALWLRGRTRTVS